MSFINNFIDTVHTGTVCPVLQDAVNEANTLLTAIKEALYEEGLTKITGPEQFYLTILDNPAHDYSLMVYDGKIILSVPKPNRRVESDNGGTLKIFELANPDVFRQIVAAVREFYV